MDRNRRKFLALAGLAPVVLIAAKAPKPAAKQAAKPAAKAPDTACYDPAVLSMSEKNSRRSVNFVEASGDPAKRCGTCAFFVMSKGNCGTCQLMTGGRVTSAGLCSSYAPKPA